MPWDEAFRAYLEDATREAVTEWVTDAALAGVLLGTENEAVWALANEQARAWAEGYTYDLVRGITDTSMARLQDHLQAAIDAGEGVADLAARIAGDESLFGAARAERIAQTEVTRAYAAGNLAAWRADGTVTGKRWHTTADDLVCPICGPLQGTTVGLDELFPSALGAIDGPPAHVGCRCWLTPEVG